ncbi:fatty acid desaturase [Adhaeribacter sp. BT258]|uniref:Fatty acid desaturase n=1 Tax=Adhaeribacter terrigena TaxID=2793070 RepID=A0ABS1C058_9BACT|nr:fatty acid desaturase [Adhaeribacter terrigena]MBK0402793.1 fatty acid desaturase [Adhaeribacter terrigena]
MAFIDELLQEPAYGWKNEKGELMKPSVWELYKEAFRRINIFKDKRNWISLISWLMAVCMVPFVYFFLADYFSWWYLGAAIVYGMVIMSTHGTVWFHRFGTHKAFTFKNKFWRIITQNLVLRTFPEEMYVLSHHVHHVKVEEPGDPYNAYAGLMYCMLSDVNHHSIAKDLSEENYKKAAGFLAHTGVQINSYDQYKKWGSVATPLYTVAIWLLNWSFWFGAFYLIGGPGLACALFGGALFWFILVRAFNYNGHGNGEAKHVDGIDFDRSNLSINQTRPGLFSGEWHNNHHLYPGSARAGFLPNQLDLAWLYIKGLHKIGGVTSYKDSKPLFLKNQLAKYQAAQQEQQEMKAGKRKVLVS